MARSGCKTASTSLLAALALAGLTLVLCCAGCLGPKTRAVSVGNVFDEMLACDIIEFSEAADATYVGEWQKLDDGFELKVEEDGVLVRYGLGRDFDNDGIPYRLTFRKTAYVPVSDGGVLKVTRREVYSGKTSALRDGGTSYAKSDQRDRVDMTDPTRTEFPYVQLSAEEAGAELESANAGELVNRLMGSPSDYFVELYLSCMDSSYSTENLGMFEDRREQVLEQG